MALVAITTIQLVVDPRGNIGTGADAFGPWRAHFGRVAKARQLGQHTYDLVILGTSRSLNGIDPSLDTWGSRKVYNASLVGTNLWETRLVFDHVLERNSPRELLIELSLISFGSKRMTSRDFPESAFNPDRERLESRLSDTLGYGSLHLALLVGSRWLTGQAREFVPREDGMRMRVGDPKSTRDLFATVLTSFAKDPNTYAGFSFGADRLGMLEEMLELASSAGIKVTLFTPPVHALQLQAIRSLGLQEDYDHMRREVANLASQPRPISVDYWDFTGWTGPRAEDIPSADDAPMEWYFDSSHFRPALGRQVVEEMFGDGPKSPDTLRLGLRLTPENLAEHFLGQENARLNWQREHRAEIQWLAAQFEVPGD
ncbi:MAG: hypothetical protein ACI8QS_001656 [Planctomycetota bacterium]